MYLKLFKAFVLQKLSLFFLIVFSISISLTGYIVNNNLVKNIQQFIGEEAKPALGGDIVIDFQGQMSSEVAQFLEGYVAGGDLLLSHQTSTLTSIEDNDGEIGLISLTFVDAHFPLYGSFEYDTINPEGNAYISEDVLNKYVKNGRLQLYEKEFIVKGIITDAPGANLDFFTRGNNVYIENYDFEDLGLDVPSTLFESQTAIQVLDENNFDQILLSIKNSPLFSEHRISDYKKGGSNFEQLFGEVGNFINYIIIISFILTILITFIAVESFFLENKKSFSILKILGLKNNKLILFNFSLFFSIFIISLLFAYGFSELVFSAVRQFELSKYFFISGFSILKAGILGLIILGASLLFPLVKFILHSPLQGLKSNFLQIYNAKEIAVEGGCITLGVVLTSYIAFGNGSKAFFSSVGVIGVITFFYLIVKWILRFIYHHALFLKKRNFCMYDAIRNTIKPGNLSVLIIFSFFITFTSFLFISIVSLNFFDRLKLDLKNDNNIFAVNITTKDLKHIDETYKNELYSILKGRILDINGVNLSDHIQKKGGTTGRGGERRFTREFNMTDNALEKFKVLEGDVLGSGEVSVDENFSNTLGISVGDTLNFLILGLEKELRVVNIRESQNNAIAPFFYFQLYKKDFESYPKTYFLSTYVEEGAIGQFKNDLVKSTRNNIYFIEVDKILAELRDLSSKILLIIQILFLYISIFCLISIIISIHFFKLFNRKKMNLYHILGSSRNYISRNNFYEYMYLQTLGCVLATLCASFLSYYLINISDFISFSTLNFIYSLCGTFVLYLVIALFLNRASKRGL